MGVLGVIKKSVAAGWNVSAWLGLKQIKQNSKLIKELTTDLKSVGKTKGSEPLAETFEQALRRLNMTEADLQERMKKSDQIILLCGILTIPTLAYAIYLFCTAFYLSSFVCVMLTILLVAYTFREHFNRFQMRQRRLGCHFQEWFADLLRPMSPRKK